MDQKPGIVEAEQLRQLAPRRKVVVGVLVLIVLQLLAHYDVGPEELGVEPGLVEVLVVAGAMWAFPERKKRS